MAAVALVAVALAGCSPSASGGSGSDAAVEAASGASVTVDKVSPSSGSLRGGTTVRLRGEGLDAVRSVRVGTTTVPVRQRTSGGLAFTTPAATRYAPGAARVRLVAGTRTIGTARFTYRAVDGVDRELQYALTYWKRYNPAFQAVDENDCVDFTSQALLRRGWRQQGTWIHDDSNAYSSGAAWVSSTAFRDFLQAHPELGTALTDDQRSRVKVGDVVQFDWDDSGDRDHTGIVTRVVTTRGKTEVYFAGHTMDSDYRSVDEAITKDHPGGAAYYWSLR